MTDDDANAASPADDGERRLQRVVAVVIRTAGVLAVFAGLALATRDLIAGAYLALVMDILVAEPEPRATAATLVASVGQIGISLAVSAWGVLLFFLARPAARFIVKGR